MAGQSGTARQFINFEEFRDLFNEHGGKDFGDPRPMV